MIDDGWDRPGFASTKKEAGPAPPPLTYTPFFVKSQQYSTYTPKNDEDRESKMKGS